MIDHKEAYATITLKSVRISLATFYGDNRVQTVPESDWGDLRESIAWTELTKIDALAQTDLSAAIAAFKALEEAQ